MRRIAVVVAGVFAAVALSILTYMHMHPVVKIGVAYNVSSYAMIPEARMLSTVKAYADWHNRTCDRFRYRVISREYKDDPRSAISTLKSEGARVVLGFPFSQEAVIAAEVANGGLGVPVLSTIASTPVLSGMDDWFFRVREDFSYETGELAKLMDRVGVKRLAVFWSGDNPAYAEESARAILAETSASMAGLLRFPDDCDELHMVGKDAPDGVLIYADPAISYWVIQYVGKKWPDATLFLSRWSLFESEGHILEIKGIKFYFSEVYDPDDYGEGGFYSYWAGLTSMGLGASVRYTYGAMSFLSQVFCDDPHVSGEALKKAMSIPRSVNSLGWSFETDRYGDISSRTRFFLFDEGSFSEVVP